MIFSNYLYLECQYFYLGFVFKPLGSFAAGMKELVSWNLKHTLWEQEDEGEQCAESVRHDHGPCGLVCSGALGHPQSSSLQLSVYRIIVKSIGVISARNCEPEICRLFLSCHKKSSCLAMLGELGRYPLLVRSLVQTIIYKWIFLNSEKRDSHSLVSEAVNEIDNLGIDDWLYRVTQVDKLQNISFHPG